MAADALREAIAHAIRATRWGVCPHCLRPINPERFDVIAKVPGLGWCHVNCAESRQTEEVSQ